MWEGVLQGAAWDTVKFAVRRALDKLSNEGFVPPPESSSSKERTFRAGWSQYSSSGRKQYEMFLSLKKTVRELPERHALAYARARKGSAKGSNPLASGQVGECIFGFSAIQPRSCRKRRFPEGSC
jgi:hypothetical protein